MYELILLNCSVGEDSWSPLDCKEIQQVHLKGNQSWMFIGRTDGKAETPILWPPDGKNWLIWKDADAGKDWRQEEKGTTENEMVGWHHRLNGHEFESTPGVGDGQGGLSRCSPWGHKESGIVLLEYSIRIDIQVLVLHKEVALVKISPSTADRDGKILSLWICIFLEFIMYSHSF